MFHRLPSLVAIRAFEAAARHGSFKAAAEELSVTPTAISHRIRALEDHLEIVLFERTVRGVSPTPAAREFATAVHRAFETLADGVTTLTQSGSHLVVSSTPAFASLFLAPRLGGFPTAAPGVDIRLLNSTSRVDLHRERQVDLAIRYGHVETKGLAATALATERMSAFASSDYLSRLDNASEVRLLEVAWQQPTLEAMSWDRWLAQDHAPRLSTEHRLKFDEEHHAIHAALASEGIVLCSSILAHDFVERGWLKEWTPQCAFTGFRYVALTTPTKATQPLVRNFIKWLTESLKGFDQSGGGVTQ